MKRNKLVSALLLVALLVAMAVPAVSAAEPSETVTVWFSYSGIYGIDGSFSFSNPGLFSSVSYSTSGMAGSAANGRVYLYSADPADVSIGVKVTVSPSAAVGDSCTITFNYQTSDVDGNMTGGAGSQTVTVTAPEGGGNGGNNGNNGNGGSGSGITEEKPKADTTELERQIAIAKGLKENEYTADSWKDLTDALNAAQALLESTDQSAVDKAAAKLSDAIAALVKMDYSKLQAAIDSAKVLTDTDEVGKEFTALISSLSDGIAKLTSTDQAEVDAAAQKLEELVAQVQQMLESLREKEIVEVEKPVEVEVEPKDPFCNISMHKIWPVLFFISLAVNVVLAVLIVLFFVRKKRAKEDTTPLVDYDIGDDEP